MEIEAEQEGKNKGSADQDNVTEENYKPLFSSNRVCLRK
jgi:hypothetical protein